MTSAKQKMGTGNRGMVPGSSAHLTKTGGEGLPVTEAREPVMKEANERNANSCGENAQARRDSKGKAPCRDPWVFRSE